MSTTFEPYKTKPSLTHEQLRARRAEIAAYINEGHSLDEAAEKFGVNKKTARRAAEEHQEKIFSSGGRQPPEAEQDDFDRLLSIQRPRDLMVVVFSVSRPRFVCETVEAEEYFDSQATANAQFESHVDFLTRNRSDYRDSHVRMRRIVFRAKEHGRDALLDMLNRGTFGMVEELEVVRFWRHPGDAGSF